MDHAFTHDRIDSQKIPFVVNLNPVNRAAIEDTYVRALYRAG